MKGEHYRMDEKRKRRRTRQSVEKQIHPVAKGEVRKRIAQRAHPRIPRGGVTKEERGGGGEGRREEGKHGS